MVDCNSPGSNPSGLNPLSGYCQNSNTTDINNSKFQAQRPPLRFTQVQQRPVAAQAKQGGYRHPGAAANFLFSAGPVDRRPVGHLPSLAATRVVTRKQAEAEAKAAPKLEDLGLETFSRKNAVQTPVRTPPIVPYVSPSLKSSGYYPVPTPSFKNSPPPPAKIAFSADPLKRLGLDEATRKALDSSDYHYSGGCLLPEGEVKIYEEFMGIADMSIPLDNPDLVSESMAERNKPSNRYTNILPFNDNRVPLSRGTYINASPIRVGNSNYIGAQGPLHHTTPAFFRMIDEHNVPLVVCLTMDKEPNRKDPNVLDNKCAPYWECSIPRPFEDGKSVQMISEETILMEGEQGLVKRRFVIKDEIKKEEKTFEQLHYINWPDHGSPHPIVFQALLRETGKPQSEGAGPTVVHCSAGVGRTGTFIATDSLIKEALADEKQGQLIKEGRGEEVPFNVAKRTVEIRCQRCHSVQSSGQYGAIRQGVLSYFQGMYV